ncbi:hypothetical protein [Planococcus faecalis]|uniref:hypothetical protein n=1 Tax=Planococcus faecalis TaxID=1598147 RepID=UPI00210BBA6E|nr:hypothetical protein [Planococcus faecalis]
MISDFKFWHFFSRQGQLIHNIQTTEMRNVNKRIACIIAIGLLVFAIGEVWGMNTSSLTPLLSAGCGTLIRWHVGLRLWAHFFGLGFM